MNTCRPSSVDQPPYCETVEQTSKDETVEQKGNGDATAKSAELLDK